MTIAGEPYGGPPWPLPAELEDSRVFDNVDLLGGDVRAVEGVESVAECQTACGTAEACVAWTLSKSNGMCWLKNSSYTRLQRNRSAALVSGVLAHGRMNTSR